jgi:hypothetical protein
VPDDLDPVSSSLSFVFLPDCDHNAAQGSIPRRESLYNATPSWLFASSKQPDALSSQAAVNADPATVSRNETAQDEDDPDGAAILS